MLTILSSTVDINSIPHKGGGQYDPPSMFFLKFLESSQRYDAGSP